MLLQVANLKVSAQFVRTEEAILKGMDFCVRSGEPLAVVGESGSGKTMCALALLGLLPENCSASGSALLNCSSDSGSAYSDGIELIGMKERKKNAMRGSELVYIPQSGAEFLNPALKIKTHIYESLKKIGVRGKSALKSVALQKLGQVGLGDESVLEKYPHQISGGQAQRVALAISLCSEPKLVIADEPTKGIDAETAKLFENVIYDCFCDACVIVITHNIELARKCKNILVLKDGEVQEYGSSASVLGAPQSEYTKQLIEALPKADEEEDYA